MEPGNNKARTQNQYGGKSGWCSCKIKTTWEKGSITETLMRHKNGLTTTLFFFFLNAKKLGRSVDAKKRGWPYQKAIENPEDAVRLFSTQNNERLVFFCSGASIEYME